MGIQFFNTSNMKNALIFIFLINLIPAFGQKKLPYDVPALPLSAKIKLEDNEPTDTRVYFFKNSQVYDTLRLTKSGKFDIELEIGFQFQAVISKAGYVSKTFTINTDVDPEILKKSSSFVNLKFKPS